MTVLAEYQRLESEGLWRATREAQLRDVIVSIGEATLTIAVPNGTALTHWSLPAIVRQNQGETPAVYSPGRDPSETLEIADPEMVEAIERVLSAIGRRPRDANWTSRGVRLAIIAAALAGLVFWLPGAVTDYAASLVPDNARAQIGEDLLAESERVAGAPCSSPSGDRALARLTGRLFPGTPVRLVILPSTLETTSRLPGGTILLGHTLVEDHETPEVVAGYAIAEYLRWREGSTLGELLEARPFMASLALLSTGHLRKSDLDRMAEWMVVKPPAPVSDAALLAAMNERQVASAPYAYAVDISGERTAELIRGSGETQMILDDNDWVALQLICGE